MSVRLGQKMPAAALEAEAIRRQATATRVRNSVASDSLDEAALGRYAATPLHIPWRGWLAVLRRTLWEVVSDRVSLVAAGCAFYATLGLFPAISMLISIYGLVFDPVTVEPQLLGLQRLVPAAAFRLVDDRVRMVVSQPMHTLGIGLLISTVATLWTAATGTKSVLSALNIAYEETETRSFLRYQATALVMTLSGILAAIVGLAALVGIPATFDFLGLSAYDTMYGPLGAIVGMMMWFWFSVLSMLIGAELNAELELQTAYDTTAGTPQPMGHRGAFVADHVAE